MIFDSWGMANRSFRALILWFGTKSFKLTPLCSTCIFREEEKPFSKIEFDMDSPDLIDDLLSALENIDKDLIEQAYKEDKEIEYETSKGMRSDTISFILSMMIFHATEHRAQIVAALDKNNERSINLDEYSIFGYVRQQG